MQKGEAEAQTRMRGGYYTVHIESDGGTIPYTVFAQSDYHAARLVRIETGYFAEEGQVEGPYRAF